VTQLSTRDYDVLERAIARGQRLAFRRRGAVLVAVPLRLVTSGRVEIVEARQPSTGEPLTIALDTVLAIEVPR
jgi:hypothetical protein